MNWKFEPTSSSSELSFSLEACRTALRLEGYTDGYKRALEDRAEIWRLQDRLILAVADGAGGRTGGAQAADQAMAFLRREAARLRPDEDADIWCELLMECDRRLLEDSEAGETTAVVAMVAAGGIVGASVGDSGAWIIRQEGIQDLTKRQIRKPFLGTGAALPLPFQSPLRDGTLLLASDGLFKYAGAEAIGRIILANDIETAAEELLDSVRLRSGNLQDDVAILLCRLCAVLATAYRAYFQTSSASGRLCVCRKWSDAPCSS